MDHPQNIEFDKQDPETTRAPGLRGLHTTAPNREGRSGIYPRALLKTHKPFIPAAIKIGQATLAIITVIVGVTVVVGWSIDIPLFVTLMPWVTVFAVTVSVVFALLALGFGSLIDITNEEIVAKNESLRRSRDFLDMAIEAAGVAVWELDLNTGKVERTIQHDRIYGYDEMLPEWSVEAFVDHVHPEDRVEAANVVAQLAGGERKHALETRIMRPNGDVRNVWLLGRMTRDAAGQPEKILGVMIDVTRRVQEEAERRQIYERITDAFAAVDKHFRFIYVNQKAAMLVDKAPEDLIGKKLRKEFPEGVGTGFQQAFLRSFGEQEFVRYEEFYPPLNKFIEVKCFPSPNGLSIYFDDVTDRVQTGKEIRKLQYGLELRILEKTLEFEAVNKELSSFAYSVSHDLRAPLRAINGFSEALIEDQFDSLNDQGKDYLDRIRRASLKMNTLIDEILKLSRVSQGDVNRTEVDLSEASRTILERLYAEDGSSRERHIEIEDGLITQGDERLVKNVLENLLGNAWKFTSKTARTEISVGRTEHKGQEMFYIRDNGAGFDMAYADKLFDAFQRLHTQMEFDGTGIGLATVRRIINRHGGTIDAKAKVDEGATFYFTFEREKKDEHE